MTDVDVASLKAFLREMTVQSLLPFMERCVTNWNELVRLPMTSVVTRRSWSLCHDAVPIQPAGHHWPSLRRGPQVLRVISSCESQPDHERCSGLQHRRRLVSSPTAPSQAVADERNSYPHATSEAISRKLGDFAFMLRDYRFAATVYDSIRKDYASDKAPKYQAGANVSSGGRLKSPQSTVAEPFLFPLPLLRCRRCSASPCS